MPTRVRCPGKRLDQEKNARLLVLSLVVSLVFVGGVDENSAFQSTARANVCVKSSRRASGATAKQSEPRSAATGSSFTTKSRQRSNPADTKAEGA